MQQDNLKKFKELPDSIKKKISESNRMNILSDFEKKYNLELAMYVVRVFVNDIKLEDLSNILVKEKNIKIEQAKKIKDELFNKVYGDIYDELQELYEEKNKKQVGQPESSFAKVTADRQTGSTQSDGANIQDLTEQYNNFISSSVFQNVLAAQPSFAKATEGKDNFYSAVNAGDKIKVVAILRAICEQGKLAENFKNDERFVEFFSAYLERHKDEKTKQEFLQNPSKPEYIIDFLQFILQKRLNFSEQESAMIGVGLAMLCSQAGEKEFASMAYGSEEKNVFVWD